MVTTSMRRVCAWCGNDILNELANNADQPITHGICRTCLASVLMINCQTTDSFLDKMEAPILVIDSDGMVRFANQSACEKLGKIQSQIQNKLGGEVIECCEAAKPGGCGKQVHCTSCTIRMTVTDTHKTGNSHINVPAYPDVMQYGKRKRLSIRISTQKIGNIVLLRIDDLREAIDVETSPHNDEQGDQNCQ